MWAFSPIILLRLECFTQYKDRSAYEAINALFSGLALAGVVYAIMLQKTDLALQRKEMRRATKEQKTQSSLMNVQINSLRKNEDFNRYTKYIEAEPRFLIEGITKDHSNRYDFITFVNFGKDIYQFLYDATFEKTKDIYKQTDMQILPRNGKFKIFFPKNSTDIRSIHIYLFYINGLNIQVRRVLYVDLIDFSITEEYNSFLENLEVPDVFYQKKNRDLFGERD